MKIGDVEIVDRGTYVTRRGSMAFAERAHVSPELHTPSWNFIGQPDEILAGPLDLTKVVEWWASDRNFIPLPKWAIDAIDGAGGGLSTETQAHKCREKAAALAAELAVLACAIKALGDKNVNLAARLEALQENARKRKPRRRRRSENR